MNKVVDNRRVNSRRFIRMQRDLEAFDALVESVYYQTDFTRKSEFKPIMQSLRTHARIMQRVIRKLQEAELI